MSRTDAQTGMTRHHAARRDATSALTLTPMQLQMAQDAGLLPAPRRPELPDDVAPAPPAADAPPAGDAAPTVDKGERHPVLSGLWTGFTYGLFGLVLLLATVVILVPRFAGGVPLTILSNSMEPTLPVGSLAVVLPIEPQDVRVGDVITYLPNPDDPTAVTHRVIGINQHADGSRTFTLKGDNNSAADDPVRDYQIRAKVWYSVPLLGHVSLAFNGEHRSPIVLGLAGVFFLWALRIWWRAWQDRRETRQRDAAIEADLR